MFKKHLKFINRYKANKDGIQTANIIWQLTAMKQH